MKHPGSESEQARRLPVTLHHPSPARWTFDELQPVHVATGLGGANREFLSVCLGVFDEATVSGRLRAVALKAAELAGLAKSVQSTAKKWREEDLTDNHLRAILWIRLQGALGVDPKVTRSCARMPAARGRPRRGCLDEAGRRHDETHREESERIGTSGLGET